jgi:DNA gyrase subunit A
MKKETVTITQMNIDDVIKEDFLSYAVSVITERAIPNIEDNLKPVHRRILFAMYKNKLTSNNKHKKSSNTVGMTMLLHPHGDAAIYDSMIRLAQPWKMRYPLIDVQGNIGSITGSPAAASRYTEAKLSPIGDLMVNELKEHSVKYIKTFDGENDEPFIMPSMFPNILCNGNMGIAVGMSSSIAPHNLKEVVNLLTTYIDKPSLTIDEIIEIMPGPDFPTGGTVINAEKIKDIYLNGTGTLLIEGKYYIEEKNRVFHIVFTEIPYLTEIENIIAKIKEMAIGELLDEVQDVQNNTGRSGLEIRIILKPNANLKKNLSLLLEYTGLRNSVRYGMTVLQKLKPIQTNLFGLMDGYLNHRHDILINIHLHKINKTKERLHIVEGLLKATRDIDGVIAIVKESPNRSAAKMSLMQKYELTDIQASAILDLKISNINKLDVFELNDEEKTLIKDLKDYQEILNSPKKRNDIIKKQLIAVQQEFGDSRRTILKNTELMQKVTEPKNFLISLFDRNVIEIADIDIISEMKKGAIGKKLYNKIPNQILSFNNKNHLLAFDKQGKVILIFGNRIENMSGTMSDLHLSIQQDIIYLLEVKPEDLQKEHLTIITTNGIIKKSLVKDYNNFKTLSFAIKLKDDDQIMTAAFTNDDSYAFVAAQNKLLKFPLTDIKASGKHTVGVKTINEKDIYSATLAGDLDKILIYDIDGKGKIVLGKDCAEGSRFSKGQVINEVPHAGLSVVNKSHIIIVGDTYKALRVAVSDLPIKGIKNQNYIIYGNRIAVLGF